MEIQSFMRLLTFLREASITMLSLYITAKVAGKHVSISEASIRSDLLFDDVDGIDSLPNQAIFDLMNVPVPLDHFPVNALTSKVFSFMVKKGKHFSGKVTPLFSNMLVQPTEDEGEQSERPSEPQPTPSPPHPSEVHVEPQSDPSPRPSPTTHIPDSIPEDSGGNHGGQSSSDKSLSGNEGDMTLQSVYDLCISLCTQVTDQAKEIQHLKAQIKKLKKKAKPVITHHRAWMKSVSLKQRLAGKKSLKKQWMQKESVSKQGRKSAKAEPTVQKYKAFDELDDDEIYNIETEDAQEMGRTRYVVHEEKERKEKEVSTKDALSTNKEKDSTDIPDEGTDKQKVSTDKEKDSTDRPDEGTIDQTEGRSATSTTPTHTPITFGDDETIAQVLLNMSQAKAVSREKEKGVELKDVENIERPRPTSTRSLLTLKPLPKIDPKDKGKKKLKRKMSLILNMKLAEEEAIKVALSNEYDFIQARIEADRLLALRFQDEEREQFTVEERAKFLHDTIKEDLKNKTFEEIQALYEKVKRFDESFTAVGSTKDERKIKEMNEGAKDLEQKRLQKKNTKKRKGGHMKMLARKRKRPQSDVDSDEEHKKCLKIVTFQGTIDSEIMERKSVITRLNKVSSPDGDYFVIYRANGNFRAFNYLLELLHIFDKQDLFHLYDLVMNQYSEVTMEGIELILWGDLKILMESSKEKNDQSDFWNNQQN
ncbi:hypothetical protein Tco_0899516 [Tanacetum coccineum]